MPLDERLGVGGDVEVFVQTGIGLADLGLTVPPRRLTKIDGRSVLILRRFDRDRTRRLGYASAMTLTGLSEGDPGDYLDLAAAIADHSGQPDADLASMWRRIAVFTAVHNIETTSATTDSSTPPPVGRWHPPST